MMMVGCCAEACTAVTIGAMRLPGCPFGSAWRLVCEVSVGSIGLMVGVSCLFCSSALPGAYNQPNVPNR